MAAGSSREATVIVAGGGDLAGLAETGTCAVEHDVRARPKEGLSCVADEGICTGAQCLGVAGIPLRDRPARGQGVGGDTDKFTVG